MLSKLALEHDVPPEDFRRLLDEVSEMPFPAYTMYTGSGNVKREKTEGRLVALQDVLAGQMGLGGVSILHIEDDISLGDSGVSGDENGNAGLEDSGNETGREDSPAEELSAHSDDGGKGVDDA